MRSLNQFQGYSLAHAQTEPTLAQYCVQIDTSMKVCEQIVAGTILYFIEASALC